MKKKYIIVWMIMAMIVSMAFPNFSVTAHWSDALKTTLIENKILNNNDTLVVGSPVTENYFDQLLNRFEDLQTVVEPTATGLENITRMGALKKIIDKLGYTYLASQQAVETSPFVDVTNNFAYVQLGLDFGIISMNTSQTFRPNEILKSEEAIAMLYHVDRLMNLTLSDLSTYYAISSYSQIDFITDADNIIFGWSRLEYDDTSDRIYLNTTSLNDNEYRIPSGYQESITKATDQTKYLMISVISDYINADTVTKSIVNNQSYMTQATEAIVNELNKDAGTFGFDGVLIDFEGLKTETSAQGLNSFLTTLKTQLNGNYKLSVAVHPVLDNNQQYYDGYDFKTIGEIADYVILMAHDYYPKKLTQEDMASAITITPVTPIDDVYTAIRGILDPITGVEDHSKVIFQLSMDSAQWKLKDGVILNDRPFRPTFSAILSRINSGVVPQYSEDLKSSFIIFQDTVDGTRNVVWYEDSRSVAAKINLALEMGIDKISVWRLGTIPNYEDEGAYLDVWKTIKSFDDIE